MVENQQPVGAGANDDLLDFDVTEDIDATAGSSSHIQRSKTQKESQPQYERADLLDLQDDCSSSEDKNSQQSQPEEVKETLQTDYLSAHQDTESAKDDFDFEFSDTRRDKKEESEFGSFVMH